jgi:Flp pilus assembly protein TadD
MTVAMNRRLKLLVILLLGFKAVGCNILNNSDQRTYQTVAENPIRETRKAQRLTEQAVKEIERGKLVKAEQSLEKALIADVTFGPAHNNLGQVYFQQGKLYLAGMEFDYARRLMPERPEPYNNLGLVYERAGRTEEAIENFSSARSLEPSNAEFIGNLVRARVKHGDRDIEVQQMLQELLLLETRPDWLEWVNEQLKLHRYSNDNSLPQGLITPEEIPAVNNRPTLLPQ